MYKGDEGREKLHELAHASDDEVEHQLHVIGVGMPLGPEEVEGHFGSHHSNIALGVGKSGLVVGEVLSVSIFYVAKKLEMIGVAGKN